MSDSQEKARSVRRILWFILGLNVLTALAKLVYGGVTSTLTIQVDGVHSLLDGSSNVLALLAMAFAHAPPDREHPYGHGRFETLGTVAIGVMILTGGVAVGREAWASLHGHHAPHPGWGGVLLVAGVAGMNFGISQYESSKGRELGSSLLVADAAHTRSDFYSSLVALLASVGIVTGHPGVDLPASLVVLGLILHTGFEVLRRELGVLADRVAVDPEAVSRVVRAVPGVRGCHKVRSRGGLASAFVDLHIQVDPSLSIRDAHSVGGAVKAAIRSAFSGVVDVLIHIEPDEEEPPIASEGEARSP